MRVTEIRASESPLLENATRISALVRYDDRAPADRVFFDLPAELVAGAESSGDPWATALLPLAMRLGEPLVIEAPMDARLQENLGAWARIYGVWFETLRLVDLRPLALERRMRPAERPVGSFFSGGVDSWYNVLADGVTTLVTVGGFDIPLQDAPAFGRLRETAREVASGIGARFAPVVTNLRETRWRMVPWGPVGHGPALAACAHFLGRRLGAMRLAGSNTYADLAPWGSHPLTDGLLSSAAMEIRHFGAEATRLEKTRLLAGCELAMRTLRVCYRLGNDRNCGHCEKCMRTRITLELLGALDRCRTLPGPPVDLGRLERLYYPPQTRPFLVELRVLARTTGRHDVVRALDRALARSVRHDRGRQALARLRQVPLAWRLHAPMQRWLGPRSL